MKTQSDLQKEVKNLENKLVDKDQVIDNKNLRIQQLENLLIQSRHKQFGASSEKTAPDQKQLFDEAETDSDLEDSVEETTIPSYKRKKKKRPSIPEDYPVEDIFYDIEDEDKFCPHDGAELVKFGEETHKQIQIIPQKIKVIRHVRFKYRCPCCAVGEKKHFITAKKPKLVIEKGIASPSLLAHIIISKYCDGLPLYRQVELFKRYNFEFDRTSFANWMIKCGDAVQSLIDLIREKILENSIVHMDETPVQVLKEPDKAAQTKSYMWVMSTANNAAKKSVLFTYSASRSAKTPVDILNNFNGVLMADGYSGYTKVCRELNLNLLACWVHARRYFKDAQLVGAKDKIKGKISKSDHALNFIAKLYAIEKKSKEYNLDKKLATRQSESKKVLEDFKKWLDKRAKDTAPKTALGKAIKYTLNQWDNLIKFADCAEYPLDNNVAENAIRPFVIGRKNWLFSDTQKGAIASANLYSLIETAKANNLNPFKYIEKVLTDLPNAENLGQIEALLPWNVNIAED